MVSGPSKTMQMPLKLTKKELDISAQLPLEQSQKARLT